MLPFRDLCILIHVNERQSRGGHYAKQGGSLRQPGGVITPSEGGHYANVNQRRSSTLVPHWSLLKSIEPEEGGSLRQATRGSPPQLAQWVGGVQPVEKPRGCAGRPGWRGCSFSWR